MTDSKDGRDDELDSELSGSASPEADEESADPVNDLASQDDHGDADDDLEEEFSLEDLGAAYAKAAAAHDPDAFVDPETLELESDDGAIDGDEAETSEEESGPADSAGDSDDFADPVTPESIVEAVLFVGHPKNEPVTLERIASLMRDFTPDEVREVIDRLNQSYRDAGQALRVVPDQHGFKLTIAPEVETVRRSFLGKVREARLNQAMIEVLALVAYQPGISVHKVNDQRGKDSGALLNQLVRRRLLELTRARDEETGKMTNFYQPTERMMVLFGLESLEDLPHVEEGFAS
ncbi:SMC-Scp complex subunit ScpB [Crateriforma spongiae]|uniref:SMC-Scp complex subunit ScpB n=1 Tax=Crateriforma spongiae TaxID=2724528 RepID=UPI0039B001FC